MEDTRPRELPRPSEHEHEHEHARTSEHVHVKSEPTCPLCLDALTALPQLEVCPACRTIHHRTCVDELGRCGTPACGGLTGAKAAAVAAAAAGDDGQRTLATAAHISAVLGGSFVIPLIVYYLTRDKQPYAAHHAWRAFVFGLVSIPLIPLTLGVWFPIMWVCMFRASRRAWRGEWNPYRRLEWLWDPDGVARTQAEQAEQLRPAKVDAKARA